MSRLIAVLTVVSLAAAVSESTAVPGTALDLNELVRLSDLVVIGRIDEVIDAGAAVIRVGDRDLIGRLAVSEMHVDDVLKGTVETRLVRFKFEMPPEPVGYGAVGSRAYCILFLRRSGDSYEFTNRYFPSVVATRVTRFRSSDPFEKVLEGLAAVLADSQSRQQKIEAIQFLRGIESSIATDALNASLSSADGVVRLAAAAAMLFVNDMRALNTAADALLDAKRDRASPQLRNVRLALANRVSDKASIPVLSTLLERGDLETKRAAVSALRNTHSELAIEALARGLEDSDTEVKYEAIMGLAETSKQVKWGPSIDEFRRDPERYLAFWKDWILKRR